MSDTDENTSHADGMLLSEAKSTKLFDGGIALKKWKSLASSQGISKAKSQATDATKKYFGGRTRRRRNGKRSRLRKTRRR